MPQIRLGDFVDVDAVITDLTIRYVIEAVDQVSNGGLARAGGAYKSDLLSGMGIERHVVQHGFFRHIAEIHVFHGNIALQLPICHAAILLMGMLPCPVASVLGALVNRTVFVHMRVHQRHIAFVLLRLFIHQGKDPLGACQRHNDGVDLVGDLGDGHVKAARQHHKCHQAAQRQQRIVGHNTHQSAGNRQHRILQIPKIIINRAQHIGELAGAVSVYPQFFIELIKVLLADFLVIKDLDYLLAGDHLLNIAIDCAQRTLLSNEIACGLSRHDLGNVNDQSHRQEHNER